MVRNVIKKSIEKALTQLTLPISEIVLTHPTVSAYGDYSTNVALRIKKDTEKPIDIAKEIVEILNKDTLLENVVEKIEIAEHGFINFHLSQKYLVDELVTIIDNKVSDGKTEKSGGKKIIIEFGQPNTHKLPHIGHFRSYTLGESISRLLEYLGNDVVRTNYQGDIGLHVAKCLWAWKKKEYKDTGNLQKNIKLLQEAYQYGSQEYEEKEDFKEEINAINTSIYQKDDSIMELWETTRSWCISNYDMLNMRLGVTYQKQYFESQTAEMGKKIVEEHKGDVFVESQGAIIFPGEKYGLHNRVFISQKGNPTYEAKDLGLAFLKRNDYQFDESYIATANEQTEYFKVVYKAVEQIDSGLASKFRHLPFGMVTLKGSKLSSRTGNIVSIDELLSVVKEELVHIMEEKQYASEAIQKTAEPLTIAACKYALLKNAANMNIVFDIGESIALEGNSGPYIEYTYVRCMSVMSKSTEGNRTLNGESYKFNEEELGIMKVLYQFSEIIEEAAKSYSPHGLCTYLFQLSQKFNLFYQTCSILSGSSDEKQMRLSITRATSIVLKNGLTVLGLPILEKM